MSVFPGDMSIGWGFGREIEHCTGSPTCQCSNCRLTEYNSGEAPEDQQLPHGYKYESPEVKENREVGLYAMDESQPTDPLLAVSELEERVEKLEEKSERLFFGIDQHEATFDAQYHRITDLEERLCSLTLVVNVLVEQKEMHEKTLHSVLDTLEILVAHLKKRNRRN